MNASGWTSTVGATQLARLLQADGGGEGWRSPRTPAYRALADRVRLLVLEGRLPVAARLPAERELAGALSVSRTTIAAAFDALRGEGFLTSRRGSGSWTAVPAGQPLPTRALDPLPPDPTGSTIDLGCASLPAPAGLLDRSFRAALADLAPSAHTHGDYPAGLPLLREALAARYTADGVPTMPEQIMVTTGAMGGVAALCRLLAVQGERVAVEHPSYANVLQLMREAGARLVPVAMAPGPAGWDLPAWRRVLRDAAPRMAYVMPDFHNPTGAQAPEEQRRELVAAARGAGTVVVADETMRDLAIGPAPGAGPRRPEPRRLAAFDPGGSTVITIGSASKTFWAGMRMGWVRAAPEVIRSLVAARAYADLGSPVLEQLALAWLLREGGWQEAVALRRAQLREYRDAMAGALRRELPDWEFELPGGGLTLWVRTAGLSGSRIADAGERLGVRVASGPRFGVDGAFEGFVRLPFTVAAPVADEAVARLAAAARMVSRTAVTAPATPTGYIT
ncbi:PLP-dependent aminotransferase family protein [Streptomyces aidingensis]|uniref:DNA-binding transcriptional regulator, MocR family, contains an aminotransferase domain n=1 Tax=Streptomyces aidingensis TaxID=910347 RepID=A0A1I1MXD6_9ACTN|nr:PLP-dependent aminotransferase family protein [Streptomyces aidingensis]SFC89835.1 DNA-binding transcriptional regulator, MocR family, contains an aminotransferase domain [Streptomyces aidingensis]